MKKILVVAESIDVDDSSGTKGRVALIKNMIKLGCDVHVYHYTRKDISIKGATCVAIKEMKFSRNYVLSRLERKLRNFLKIDIHHTLEKIWGFSFTLFNDRDSIIKGLKGINFQPDLVFTFSKGGSFRPHHAILKMPEYHQKWVAYIHDPYPMHLYPRPYAWVEPGYYKKWKFMKDISIHAAYPTFPSYLLKEWMGSYFEGYQKKGIIIPHQMDKSLKTGQDINLENWDPSKFNVLHAGSLLHARNPKALLQAFRKFVEILPEEEQDKVCLYFVGSANNHKNILADFSQKVAQIRFLDKTVSFKNVYSIQHQAAVNVILEARSEISPFLPGKFPHCVAANKPIFSLSPYYSEVKRLLGKDYPYWCEADDEVEILKFLNKAYAAWKKGAGYLNRPDLEKYLSMDYLENTINIF